VPSEPRFTELDGFFKDTAGTIHLPDRTTVVFAHPDRPGLYYDGDGNFYANGKPYGEPQTVAAEPETTIEPAAPEVLAELAGGLDIDERVFDPDAALSEDEAKRIVNESTELQAMIETLAQQVAARSQSELAEDDDELASLSESDLAGLMSLLA
jgi:hypothetical protein